MNRAIITLAAIAMVVGCAKDGATESLTADSLVQFTTDNAVTRVETATSTTGVSTWETGDFIGISSDNGDSNVKYMATVDEDSVVTFSAAEGVDPIMMPRNTAVKYRAYYPWQSDGTYYSADLTDQTDLGAIDFLVAPAVSVTEGDEDVKFVFGHKLAMAQFTVVLGDDLLAQYDDWSTKFNTYIPHLTLSNAVTKASYFLTGDYLEGSKLSGDIEVPFSTGGVATAILASTMNTTNMTMSIEYGGKSYEVEFSCASNVGTIHNYTVEVGYGKIELIDIEIKDWNIYDWGDESTDDELGQATEIVDGTADAPFEINDIYDLAYVGSGETHNGSTEKWDASAHYVITTDLDNDTGSFTPAISANNHFYGVLDGNGKSINNLNISTPGVTHTALLPYVGAGAVVKDLNIVDCNIYSDAGYVGAIAGYNAGTITNCTVSGKVITSEAPSSSDGCGTGGIAGANAGTIDLCISSATVTGYWKVGGVVGYLDEGYIINSANTGEVTNSTTGKSAADEVIQQGVGGVAGTSDAGTVIANCYNNGAVNGAGLFQTGGVVGFANSTEISACYNSGLLSGYTETADSGFTGYVGGVVGRVSGQDIAESNYNITSCFYQTNSGASVGIGSYTVWPKNTTYITVEDLDGRTRALGQDIFQSRNYFTYNGVDEMYFNDIYMDAAVAANKEYTDVTLYFWSVETNDYPVIDSSYEAKE